MGVGLNQRGVYWTNLYCFWPEESLSEPDVFFADEETEPFADVVAGAGLIGRNVLTYVSPEEGFL